MNHIKPYQLFENNQEYPSFPTTEEEIHKICKKYNIKNYTINKDLSIDVNGSVDLKLYNLEYLPLSFNYVKETFNCGGNHYLKTLKGSPNEVGGDFICFDNNLTSLEHSPEKIEGIFNCKHNHLKTLYNFPLYIGGDILINNNPIYYISIMFINNDNAKELIKEFNHYRIIENDTIYSDRLEMFIGDFDLETNFDKLKIDEIDFDKAMKYYDFK